MNLLRNGRSYRDSLVSKSSFVHCISWCCNWFIEFCIEFLDKATGQEPFFRDDYRKEIDPLLDHFHDFLFARSWASWALRPIFDSNPRKSKRILQHLYTCPETRSFYEIVRDMAKSIEEQEKQDVTTNSGASNYIIGAINRTKYGYD